MTPRGSDRQVSAFRPGDNCCRVVRAERVGLIVDGEDYFRAFAEAAQSAVESILILAWDFDSRTVLTFNEAGRPSLILGDFLTRLVRERPALNIHILIWDYPVIYGFDRQFPPIYGIGWRPGRRIHIHYDDVIPVGGCHHQKVVVIDDRIAFAGGIDLTMRRWDTSAHRAEEPCRVAGGDTYPPFHDAMMAVSGAAARALGDLARERWQRATGKPLPVARSRRPGWTRRRPVATEPWPPSVDAALEDVEVAIARTMPPEGETPAVREIETLYLDMLRAARHSIYIENQYFTAAGLGDLLAERLAEPDGPDIVLVIRLLSHGWLEGVSMESLRTTLILRLRAADRHGRFRVFYPHVPGLPEEECLDVHAKLMVVDDEFLRIGSANFANRSMGVDSECDLAVEARGDPERSAVIAGFRHRLLAEHLGTDAGTVAAAEKGRRLVAAIESLLAAESAGQYGRTFRELEVTADTSDTLGGIAKLADPEAVVPLDRLVREFSPPAAGPLRYTWLPIAVAAGVLAGLAALWRWTPLGAMASPERVLEWVAMAGDALWVIPALLAGYTVAAFLMFPRPLLTLFAVLAFGPWIGFGLAMTGMLFATLVTYLVGIRLDRHAVRRLAGRNLNRVTDALRRRGVLAMTLVRLVPMAPFAVIGIVAGALRLRLRSLILGTALGTLPGTLLTTVAGDRIAALLRDARPADWLLLGLVVATAAVAMLVLRRFGHRVQLPTGPPARR